MSNRALRFGFPLIGLLAMSPACGKNPTAPVNRPPIIHGVTVTPTPLYAGDSALMVCIAGDPDGDALVLDWYADGRFRLKDAPLVVYRFSSPSDSQIIYYEDPLAPLDTARVYCFARDPQGLAAGVLVRFILMQ